MINYSLALCYGIIVPADKIQEFKQVLTNKEYNMILDYYSCCINCWTGEDYFIGIMTNLTGDRINLVYHVPEFTIPADNNEELIEFKHFFTEHDLWKFIDWKPELLLINFCY